VGCQVLHQAALPLAATFRRLRAAPLPCHQALISTTPTCIDSIRIQFVNGLLDDVVKVRQCRQGRSHLRLGYGRLLLHSVNEPLSNQDDYGPYDYYQSNP
jgi:hypothetical protein